MTPQHPALDSAVAEAIISLLDGGPTDPDALCSALEELNERWGDHVYTVLLFVLTHLDVPGDKARRQWEQAVGHWKELNERLAEPVDVRVALLHHLLGSPRRLRNPAIVEIRILRRTHDSAMLDELTRVHNYRYFQDRVTAEARRAERYGSALTLLMADADDFKAYNDGHGHLAGNVALRRLASVLRRAVRSVDVVARYGGEEFAILLPNTPKLAALKVAEKVRQSVERAGIGTRPGSAEKALTVSIGLASLPGDASSAQELVGRADRALYAAKSRGKNCVVPFSDERRDYPRVAASVPGRFSEVSPETHPLTTRNVSEGGLMFVSQRPLTVGAIARVQLSLPPDGEAVDCAMRVVRAARCADGYHVSGPIVHMPKLHVRRFRLFLRSLREQTAAGVATSGRTRGPAAS